MMASDSTHGTPTAPHPLHLLSPAPNPRLQYNLPVEDSAPIVDGLEQRLAAARAEAAAAASRILLATIRVNVDGDLIPLSIYNGAAPLPTRAGVLPGLLYRCLMWSVGVTSQGGGWGVVGHSTPMGCAMCTVQLPMTHHPSCRTPVTG